MPQKKLIAARPGNVKSRLCSGLPPKLCIFPDISDDNCVVWYCVRSFKLQERLSTSGSDPGHSECLQRAHHPFVASVALVYQPPKSMFVGAGMA